jgi:hypothetical protein
MSSGQKPYRVRTVREPAEAEAIKEAATGVLRGESIRSIAFDFNDRGVQPVWGRKMGGVDAAPNPGLAEDRGSAGAQRRDGRRCGVACDHRPDHP